jgi:hypothetical protein
MKPKGFSSKEIQQNFIEESKAKLKPEQARLSYARSRRNLSDALDSGELALFLQSLDAIGLWKVRLREKRLCVYSTGSTGRIPDDLQFLACVPIFLN